MTVFREWLNSVLVCLRWRLILPILDFNSSLRWEIWCCSNIYGSVSIAAGWKNVNIMTESVFIYACCTLFLLHPLVLADWSSPTHTLLMGTLHSASICPLSIFKSARLEDGLSNKCCFLEPTKTLGHVGLTRMTLLKPSKGKQTLTDSIILLLKLHRLV